MMLGHPNIQAHFSQDCHYYFRDGTNSTPLRFAKLATSCQFAQGAANKATRHSKTGQLEGDFATKSRYQRR
jgi:hypothetical protein